MNDAKRIRQLLHQKACTACVVKMNVGQENIVDVRSIEVLLMQRIDEQRNTVVCSGIDERGTAALNDQVTRILQGSLILRVDGRNAIA